jgi:hypothetical protein
MHDAVMASLQLAMMTASLWTMPTASKMPAPVLDWCRVLFPKNFSPSPGVCQF